MLLKRLGFRVSEGIISSPYSGLSGSSEVCRNAWLRLHLPGGPKVGKPASLNTEDLWG